MKNLFLLLVSVVLVSCGGGGGSDGGSTPPEEPDTNEEPAPNEEPDTNESIVARAFIVQNDSSNSYVSSNGNLTDIPAGDTVIVYDGKKGFSFGFGEVQANEYGNILAEDGEQIYLGVAAVRPDSDVGAAVTVSSISFGGSYQLQYQPLDEQGELGELENANGTVQIKVDLASGNGTITDDFMSGSSDAINGSDLLIGDGTIDGQDFSLEVGYENAIGYLDGMFGVDGLVGAMAGSSEDGFFVGGIIADAE